MKLKTVILMVMVLCSWTQVWAQQDKTMVRIDLRVSALGPVGSVVVDRGKSHKVEIGDIVLFTSRDGRTYRGRVSQLDDRSAIVTLDDRRLPVLVGTRGQVLIPSERDPQVTRKPVLIPEPVRPEVSEEHPPWENKDKKFSPEMPLLALVKPVRPEDRGVQVSGRLYTTIDLGRTSGDGSANSYMRSGAETTIENPFGKGGGMHLEGEFDYRTEHNNRKGADLNLHRFSYYSGGTRFDDERWEVGRFLQHGMPEFGILDGVEWGRRLENADRIGASFGFMPELDDDLDTAKDLQFSAYYLWAADDRELLAAGLGIQKTFHKGDSDRDLLVAKITYLPLDSWDFHGTVWLDFFEGNDNVKGKGAEVSHALASLGRRWKSGNGVNLTFRHNQFPELLRNDFLDLGPQGLDDSRYDRLSFSGWNWVNKENKVHGRASIWNDEEESGGSAEMGLEVKDLFLDRSVADLTLFGTAAKFSDGGGIRVSYGRYVENGRWDLFYEVGNHRFESFPSNADDLIQQRFRASRSFTMVSDWMFSVHADAFLWDEEFSWLLGFNMNKSF